MPRSLIVEILGDARQFASELDKAAGKTASLGKVAGVAGFALAGGLAVGLDKSVEAAMHAQESTARLDTAFKSSGQSADKYKTQIEDAESANRKLGFTSSETKDALGSLEIATHDGTAAIKDLGIAGDIARFKHTDLASASKTLTMAMSGSQRAVKQLGLTLQPVTAQYDALKQKYQQLGESIPPAEAAAAKFADKQTTAANVIDLVNKKLGGQAQAYADTAAGGMAQFHAQVDQIEEKLGAALLPALTKVADALAAGATFLANHSTLAKVLVGALGALAAVLVTVSVAAKIAAAAETILDVAMNANPIGLVVIALAALAAGFIYAWTHSETFRNIVKGVFADIKAAGEWVVQTAENIKDAFLRVISWARANWPLLVGILTGPIGLAVAEIVTHWHQISSAAQTVLNNVVGFFRALPGRILGALGDLSHLLTSAGADVVNGLWDGMKSKFDAVKGWLGSKAGELAGGFKSVLGIGSPSKVFHDIGSDIMTGLNNGMAEGAPSALKFASDVGSEIGRHVISAYSEMMKNMPKGVPGWTVAGAVADAQAAEASAAALAQQNSEFNRLFNVDTTFATPGWTPSMSAAQVYALSNQQPVVVNVAGSVSTQQDLVKSIQTGLAQTASRNVTAGIS